MAIGADAVVDWVESNIDPDKPIYSVWQGKNLLYSYVDADYDKSIQLLRENLEAGIQNGYDEILKIQLHDIMPGDKARRKHVHEFKTIYASLTFRICDPKPSGYTQPYNPVLSAENSKILTTLNGINERITAIEENSLENIPENTNQEVKPDFYSLINDFLKHPVVQTKVVTAVCGILDKITGIININAPVMAQPKIAGIPETATINEKVEYAINTLMQVHPAIVDDLVKLAELSKTDPAKVQFLISMLPK